MKDNTKVILYFVALGLVLVGCILIFIFVDPKECMTDPYGNKVC